MVFFDNGTDSVSIERRGGKLRVHQGVHTSGRPPWIAICDFDQWTPDIGFVSGALGELPTPHQALIVRALHQAGITWMVTERARGGTPLATRIMEGPLQGYFLTDLREALKRVNRRYPVGGGPREIDP